MGGMHCILQHGAMYVCVCMYTPIPSYKISTISMYNLYCLNEMQLQTFAVDPSDQAGSAGQGWQD